MHRWAALILLLFVAGCATGNVGIMLDEQSSLINPNPAQHRSGITAVTVNGTDMFITAGYNAPNEQIFYNGADYTRETLSGYLGSQRENIGFLACNIDDDADEELYAFNAERLESGTYQDAVLDYRNGSWTELNDSLFTRQHDFSAVTCHAFSNTTYAPLFATEDEARLLGRTIRSLEEPPAVSYTIANAYFPGIGYATFISDDSGPNHFYINTNQTNVAEALNIDDPYQQPRGIGFADLGYDGSVDILYGTNGGPKRAYQWNGEEFVDVADPIYRARTENRNILIADIDNDGYDEVFTDNVGDDGLFKIKGNNVLPARLSSGPTKIPETTGISVADLDGDGVLEIIMSTEDPVDTPLLMYEVRDAYPASLRVQPLNEAGAPARGATVTITYDNRTWSKVIDSGTRTNQNEAFAHFGLRNAPGVEELTVYWPNGVNHTYENIPSGEYKVSVGGDLYSNPE